MDNVDKATVLDLLVIIDDERRLHATAAVLASGEAERQHHASIARENAMLISSIKRDMARSTLQHASRARQARRLDVYVERLLDSYLDNGGDVDVSSTSEHHKRRPAG